jgi:hypothetical protein
MRCRSNRNDALSVRTELYPQASGTLSVVPQVDLAPAVAVQGRGPRRLHVRGHPQWRELFPHLDELGIKVAALVQKIERSRENFLTAPRT